MNSAKRTTVFWVLIFGMAVPASVGAVQKSKSLPQQPLSPYGQQLQARYTQQLESLKSEIERALPALAESKRTALIRSQEAEVAAKAELEELQQKLAGLDAAQALVDHARNKWIAGAEKGIANAAAQLEIARTEDDRNKAQEELAKWQANRAEGLQALAERQAAVEKARTERPGVEQALLRAKESKTRAEAQTMRALRELGLQTILSSKALDAKLAKYVVMHEATPRGLAEFAEQGDRQSGLMDLMLSNDELLVQMAVADGARDGKYGRALQIYSDIQRASSLSHDGTLQRLALAIGLEHAVPMAQRNAVSATDAPTTVDPVKRYQHFEKAFLGNELDPCFQGLSVWEYRMVVDGEEPDEILAWGRQMLRNYRPDQISTPDYRWRYVNSVRTEIRYGSQDNQYDRDDLQFFQNILMNGGVCGRRAFFGRFILRAFGIPTTARPQKGHAALVHWTPDGWVVCLGANWGSGWTKTRYNKDLDFLANTQARSTGETFMQVKRAQWIGDVMGEKPVFGLLSGNPGFWYGVSLYVQRSIVAEAQAKTLDAVGEDIAEANESRQREPRETVTLIDADKKIAISSSGVITIPATATRQPTNSTDKIVFMNSNLGGKQLHYSRNGKPEPFEYTFDVPAAGRYALTARVVTPSWRQSLQLAVNGASQTIDIPLPFTVGMWETTQPVEIELVQGQNLLRFSRDGDIKGCTIKDFRLLPLSGSAKN